MLNRPALETVTPPIDTGSKSATGLTTPVRPTLQETSLSTVTARRLGNFQATAHRGERLRRPRRCWSVPSSTFTTTPSSSKAIASRAASSSR